MTPTMTARPRLLSVEETAQDLRVCTKTVRRLIERGDLPSHRVGRCIRISEEELRRYLRRTQLMSSNVHLSHCQ